MTKILAIIRSLRNSYNAMRRGKRVGGFDILSIYNGHFNIKYRGVPALKCPFDYVLYQMLISEIQPDLVIEIGTSNGGTTLYLADLMNAIGHGAIHTIDKDNGISPTTLQHPRVTSFREGWEGYDLENAKGFSKIMIIDDASHQYEDVLQTIEKFAPLVSLGSYFIVEDGIVTRIERDMALAGGPLKAVHEFLRKNQDFKIDRKYCDFFGKNATFNPDGYLQRVK
ncbi:MAG: CmcI family methyltransferase [Patescibacteria group bacterium]